MSKKMMKRSLALGALMAFVITGSAMAASYVDQDFTSADATNVNKVVANGHGYGACLNASTSTSLKDCDYVDNSLNATQSGKLAYGGAIYVKGDLTVDNCSFIGNSVTAASKAYGGAIAHQNGKLDIVNTIFDNNSAKTYGAAIYASGSQVTITGSTFKNHNTSGNGLIYLVGGSKLTLGDGNTFENNGVASFNVQSGSTLTLEGENTFKGNSNNSIFNKGEIVFAEGSNTQFVENTAVDFGGSGNVVVDNEATVKSEAGIITTGVFELNGNLEVGADSSIKNLEGENGKITFLSGVDLNVENNDTKGLTFAATGVANDDVAGDANKLLEGIALNGTENTEMTLEEGNIQGAKVVNLVFNEENELEEVKVISEAINSKSDAVSDAGMALKGHWRAHMNDMNKRMGELRNANGEAGVWTRMVRGESEYQGAKMQYNQYQLGYDEKLSVDKRWIVGAAVTFTEGDASYGQGSTEDKSTAFAIYGSKLNNDGTFVDLIARYAHLESDLDDTNYGTGDYGTNGMSVSAEFGKRIQQGKGLWIEPQVELTYGTVDSATVSFSNGYKANYDSMDSFIARAGFALGKDIKQGNVYARASYLYDFDGETTTQFEGGKAISEDFGGGWWEVGVGANINLSKATYIYADVEKTFGGEVGTNWKWNLGVRYSF